VIIRLFTLFVTKSIMMCLAAAVQNNKGIPGGLPRSLTSPSAQPGGRMGISRSVRL
jgi:hypothetical protein